jgi:NAD(P)-dependent dehydrogenase (short-subunit alcohol dehydrogenase family)
VSDDAHAMPDLASFPRDGVALVFGARGGIGAALHEQLVATQHFRTVLGFHRHGSPPVDITRERDIVAAIEQAEGCGPLRLVLDATGFLHDAARRPEKSWHELDAAHLAHAFAINAIGPALLLKHALPRLPRAGKAVFATLSARVGSIGDNRLGGWYAYRASKAALNQLVRTAAIELARRAPDACCVALHPGTVATPLSAPFAKRVPAPQAPEVAATHLLQVIERLQPGDSGSFLDWRGASLPW